MVTIFANGLVITVDPNRNIIENGAVVVKDDRIIDIGPADLILVSIWLRGDGHRL